jgi:hypothetical protein
MLRTGIRFAAGCLSRQFPLAFLSFPPFDKEITGAFVPDIPRANLPQGDELLHTSFSRIFLMMRKSFSSANLPHPPRSSEMDTGLRRPGVCFSQVTDATSLFRIVSGFDQKGIVRYGGESGIRTHVRVSPKHAFQACAFSHSAISPASRNCEILMKLAGAV